MKKIIFLMFVGFSFLFTAAGNTPPIFPAAQFPPMPPSDSGSNFPGRGGSGFRPDGNFLERLKSRYPDEVGEIEKLQSSDPEAARAKIRELMSKNMRSWNGHSRRMFNNGFNPGAALELTAEQLEEIKTKLPEEFAEYEKLKNEDPAKAAEKLRELFKKVYPDHNLENNGNIKGLRDRHRRSVEMIKRELKRRYPERYAEIEKISLKNPDAGREELRKLFKESNLRMPGGARELVYEYQAPNLQNNNPGMMNRNFFPRGMMNGPWQRGGR